ncbi:hypothetical protein FACS189499_02560 [Clostridia bacterium]|nr:hypothetical protein FACS189499_02560 [Clostridia bacterium]
MCKETEIFALHYIIIKILGFVYMQNVKSFTQFVNFLLIIVLILLNLSFFSVKSSAFPYEGDRVIYSDGVYMVNIDTDIVIYKKDEFKAVYPASTTKIMTALLTLENVSNLDDFVTITYDATDEFWGNDPNKRNPSNAALEPGQKNITYRDCLYALMLASACEAGNILAYSVGGDIPTFVAMMNKKAAEIGCVNTHFGNAHGLHQTDNFSCAYDMYLISKYAYDNYPLFKEICGTYQYDFPPNSSNPDGYTKVSTNKLMQNNSANEYYYEFASGIKTGSIDYFYNLETGEKTEGNSSLVSTASKSGFTYMLVTLGAPYHDLETKSIVRPYSFDDHLTLYKWAFRTFTYQTVLSQNEVMASVNVTQGEGADVVRLKPTEDYSTLLPESLDNSTIQRIVTKFSEEVQAPVAEGEILGRVELKLRNETLAVIDLESMESVERSQAAYLTERVEGIVGQKWVKISVVALIVLIVTAVILTSVNKSKKARSVRAAKRRKR